MRRLTLRGLAAILFLLLSVPASAQVDGVLQIDDGLHRFLVRQQLAGRLDWAHLTHQPLSAGDAQAYLDSLSQDSGLNSLGLMFDQEA